MHQLPFVVWRDYLLQYQKLMGEIDALYLPYVETAASQIAFVVVISTIITPILVKKLSQNLK